MRERGNLWPVIAVAGGALLVLVVVPLIAQRERSGRMATVEAQVSIGDTGSSAAAYHNPLMYRWPDSEVPRTVERLRDVSSVALAAITYVVESAFNGRTPRNVGEILTAIAQRDLFPREWLTRQPGVLRMPRGTVHLRYSPSTLTIEVVSVPDDRSDGSAILIRIPDSENTAVGPRYFESMQLDGIVYPNAFAPVPEIIACGWLPRLFKQTRLPDAEAKQLEHWARTASRK
jgi:hypothetical protein